MAGKKATRRVKSAAKELVPVRAFSTRQSLSAKSTSKLMTYNQPTYSDSELEYFEDAWATTPAGLALDKRMEFVLLGGVRQYLN